MNTQSIMLLGAGGHALSCIDVIEAEKNFEIEGLVAENLAVGSGRYGYSVIGVDADLPRLRKKTKYALVCIGQIASPTSRIRAFRLLRDLEYVLPKIIAPTAFVSPRASIGEGSIVMHGAIVNAGAEIGRNCIINSRALIEHGVKVGDHCHISTGSVLNGDTRVGFGSFVGSGSLLKEGVHVGDRCVIGLGVKVFAHVENDVTVSDRAT